MTLIINGRKEEFQDMQKVTDLLGRLQIKEEESGFAVAVNEEVVFRSTWQNALLSDGDRVEIIRATQGG